MQKVESGQPAPLLQEVATSEVLNEEEETLRAPGVRRADWYDANTTSSVESYSTLRGIQSGPPSMPTDYNGDEGQTATAELGLVQPSITAKVDAMPEINAIRHPSLPHLEAPPSIMEKLLGRKAKAKGKERRAAPRLSTGLDSLRRVQSVIGASTPTTIFPRGQGDQEEFIL